MDDEYILITDPSQYAKIDVPLYRAKIKYACKYCGKMVHNEYVKLTFKYQQTMTCKACYTKYILDKETAKKRREETNIRLTGFSTPLKDPNKRKEWEDRNVEIYGERHPYSYGSDSFKRLMAERYGDECPNKTEYVKNKVANFWLEKTNGQYTSNLATPEHRLITKVICQNLYGDPNYNNPKKAEATYMRRTGYRKPGCNPNVNSERYSSKYNYFGILFDSEWELCVWLYCVFFNIPIVRNPIKLYYDYNGEQHFTTPDFCINGTFIEIKGNQFLEEHGNVYGNWINSYDRSEDGKMMAKRNCLLSNGVLLFGEKECLPYITWVRAWFGVHYLDSFRVKRVIHIEDNVYVRTNYIYKNYSSFYPYYNFNLYKNFYFIDNGVTIWDLS